MKKARLLFGLFLLSFIAIGCAAKIEKIGATNADLNVSVEAKEDNLTAIDEPKTGSQTEIDAENKTIGSVAKLALGERHAIALDIDGKVWTSGNNDFGQLGAGDFTVKTQSNSLSAFKLVGSLTDKTIVDIAAGYDQTFAIDDTGGAFSSGRNDFGQLGAGDFTDRNVFEKIESLSGVRVTAIASGKQHTIALDSEGGVWAAGANSLGQLGIDDTDAKNAFVKVSSLSGKKIVAIAAGRYHSVALDSEGAIWVSGSNSYGQLGLGYGGVGTIESGFKPANAGGNKIVAIACGENHAIALDSYGAIWTSGLNRNGQLGLGDSIDRVVFEKYSSPQKFAAIAAGANQTIALDNYGAIWTSGGAIADNRLSFARASAGDAAIVAIASGSNAAFAIAFNGDVLLSGQSADGQIGRSASYHTFGKVELRADAIDLEALYDRGFKKICDPATQKPNISDKVITSIAAGDSHTIVIDDQGKMFASGYNERGQLGLNDADNRVSFAAITYLRDANITAIAAGEQHAIALDSEGGVWVSGHNDYNQLGFEKTEDRRIFTKVKDISDKNVTSVAAGAYHSLALDSDGRVWVSGRNNRGQLGMGDAYDSAVFTIATSLKDKTIVKIAAGAYHSLALDDKGGVFSSGANDEGQLGEGDRDRATFTLVRSLSARTIVKIAAGENFSLALDSEGKIWAVGSNEYGQLGLASGAIAQASFTRISSLKGVFITDIAAGDRHALALDSEGKAYATGLNDDGQLGLGDRRDRLAFSAIESLGAKTILSAAAGEKHSILLDSEGRIWVSGQNYYGQLGLDDTIDRDIFTSLEPTGCVESPAAF
ncbi:MAG: hypothetical protein LBF86_05385 [Helicobacteraceae bacterium]|nr:hypothetical protein [Helicobacteraceae bacterium]